MDGGSEFISRSLDEFLNEYNITPRYTNTGEKNNVGIIERANRTIREKIQTHFNITDSLTYYYIVDNHQLENTINNTYNRSINSAPISLTTQHIKNNNEKLKEYNTDLFKDIDLKFGDKVRIKLRKNRFDKLGNNYSKTIHTITDIYGQSANLDIDNTKHYKLNKLLKVDNNTENNNNNSALGSERTLALQSNDKEIETIKKQKKQKRFLKKEGLI